MSLAVDIWHAGQPLGYNRPFPTSNIIESIGRGLVPGASLFRVIGLNADVDDVREDVWEPGGVYVFPPDTGVQMRVVSTSSNDVDGGTGARKVDLHYLDVAGVPQTIEIVMNGVAPVLTSVSDIRRVQDFHVKEAGSLSLSAGSISLTSLDGLTVYARVSANSNRGRQAVWTVPAGKRAFITEAWIGGNADGGSSANFAEGYLRATCDFTTSELTPGLFNFSWGMIAAGNTIGGMMSIPVILPAMCDVKISALSRAANSNVRVIGAFAGWYENV